jgi:putative ABC transport system ATP-binding protein
MDVTLEGVTKVFGSGEAAIAALRGVELVVTSGSHVAVVGSSGSGKSTLLHLVGGLDSPSSGSIHADGVDVASLRGRRLVACPWPWKSPR